ncbi:hypothetical protein [Bartonella sp. B41]
MRDVDHQYGNIPLSSKQRKEPLLDVPFIVIVLIALCFFYLFYSSVFFSDQLYIENFDFFYLRKRFLGIPHYRFVIRPLVIH